MTAALVWASAAGAQEELKRPAELDPQPAPSEVESHQELRAELALLREVVDSLRQAALLPRENTTTRRTFGFGLAGGGGIQGQTEIGTTLQDGLQATSASLEGRLPTLELRIFTPVGFAIDLSVPVGDIVARLARKRGFLFESAVILDLNPRVADGVHLVIGPGLGFEVGEYALSYVRDPAAPNFGQYNTAPGGAGRLIVQAGAELIAAKGLLSVALVARPWAGFKSWDASTAYGNEPYSPTQATKRTFFEGGIEAMVRLTVHPGKAP